jgi:hypothetical protein
MGCMPQTLPLTYLGMPLTVTKPCKELYMSLIERVVRRHEGVIGEADFQRRKSADSKL